MGMLMYGYTQLHFRNARTFQTFAIRILKKVFSQIVQYRSLPLTSDFKFVTMILIQCFPNPARCCNLLPLDETSRAERYGTAVDLFPLA